MSHLGRWLSALVDGELEGEERDRVLNHVAGCAGCRQEANAMRALKRRLTALGDTVAEPAIASRLMELARISRPAADDLDFTFARSFGSSASSAQSDSSHPARLGARLLAATASAALAAVGLVAFLLGSANGAAEPKVTPSVDTYLLQHAYDAGQAAAGSTSVTAPASGLRHGARVAGPALGRPEQFGPGPAAPFAPSGTVSGVGSLSGVAAKVGSATSGRGRSSTPMVSQHLG
jgi:anti-sigma factor RsiW